ncbi:Ubiquinone biosynthesis hydroxylase,UbiH/UbiF/VisC/COQ6 family [Candidatus Glomeribacter gigasporarum BEG34]|uniref:Ubiquinone biosynthesis hydroxylase,UbiH/UbiF/VisC/COQ6 family n=1 Tax=Candidatus Glomeribacter gigasporarum BEG34 TaxID=1070319 RepID=G2J8K3_9BURK|nr:UbiH/UbiF family hydroxylase [Candidatus Glomeribacter gigasporarum]CCD29100.1 Ubiquinone biosynthesis hydroxylase,UbiH/UbiF/VisC/COQ6 family [Candidatus Glomeribacter gigasporarum BEG34]
MSDFNSIFDASVVGGGIVGKTAALALARTGLRVALLARAPAPLPANAAACDGRVYAVSGGTQRLLERLRVWQALDRARLSPVYDMRVYGDAHAELHFSAFQAAVPELAWIVESSLLEGALDTALGFHPSVEILNASAQKLRVSSDMAALELEDGAPLKARLVVGADGAHSWVRAQSGIPCTQREYGQTALTAQFQAEQPHREAAYQWFRNGEIIALLPLPENKVSLVWSAHTPHARALRALDVPSFAAAVEQGSERRLGALQCLSPVRGFALALCKASRLIAPRVALVGDAAHVIHPLAGQGLNLGVRDVAALARTVAAREPFRDPGDPVLLRRYERSRRADIQLLMAATDGLYRLFSWSGAVPRGVRNAGFKLVNAMPRIKRWLASYSVHAPV